VRSLVFPVEESSQSRKWRSGRRMPLQGHSVDVFGVRGDAAPQFFGEKQRCELEHQKTKKPSHPLPRARKRAAVRAKQN